MEGETVTLEWTYILHGQGFFQLRFSIQGGQFLVAKSGGSAAVIPSGFRGRITGNITESFASVKFLSINRTDSNIYTMQVSNLNGDETAVTVEIQVQCKLQMGFNHLI